MLREYGDHTLRFTLFMVAASPSGKQDEQRRAREVGAAAVARMLDVSISTVYRYVDAGDLRPRNAAPRTRQRRSLRFLIEEVEILRESQRSTSRD